MAEVLGIPPGGYTRGGYTAKKTSGGKRFRVYTVFKMSDGTTEGVFREWGEACRLVDSLAGPATPKESDEEYAARIAAIPSDRLRRSSELPPINPKHGGPF